MVTSVRSGRTPVTSHGRAVCLRFGSFADQTPRDLGHAPCPGPPDISRG